MYLFTLQFTIILLISCAAVLAKHTEMVETQKLVASDSMLQQGFINF